MLNLPRQNTYVIRRAELRRILVAFGVSDKNIQGLFGSMDKLHMHVNVIAFAGMLEKIGLDRERIGNILRRLGMDDIIINTVFDMVDEQKISVETGRLYNAVVDFS